MKKLSTYIDELANFIPDMEKRNEGISASNVGWQIEHSLLTIRRVSSGILASDPQTYTWSLNFTKLLIFYSGKIPRGKAKAPKYVTPEDFTQESLQKHMIKVKEAIAELGNAHPNQFVEHPYFGKINKKETIRFLGIHTLHHIKIIREIVAAENSKAYPA
jgi:hypothetical protein